jgi:hypothetical protein
MATNKHATIEVTLGSGVFYAVCFQAIYIAKKSGPF